MQAVTFTLFWDIYNQDPEAIEEFRRRRKAKFATRHGKVKLAIQLKTGDPAALRTVLDANGVDVEGLDLVRGSARTRDFSRPAQIYFLRLAPLRSSRDATGARPRYDAIDASTSYELQDPVSRSLMSVVPQTSTSITERLAIDHPTPSYPRRPRM